MQLHSISTAHAACLVQHALYTEPPSSDHLISGLTATLQQRLAGHSHKVVWVVVAGLKVFDKAVGLQQLCITEVAIGVQQLLTLRNVPLCNNAGADALHASSGYDSGAVAAENYC